MAGGRVSRLPVDQPLDLAGSLESGQAFRWRRHGDWYCGVVDGSLVHVRQEEGGVVVEGGPEEPVALANRVAGYLRLDDPAPEIYRDLCRRDERLAGAVRCRPGLRVLRQDPWECLVAFILSANSSVPRIGRDLEAVARYGGTPVSWDGCLRAAMPPASALGQAEEPLRAAGLGFRAGYVAAAARLVAGGELDLDALRRVSREEAGRALVSVPGVGEKVAECVMLFSLEKLDAFPVDRWVRRALAEWYGLGDRGGGDSLRRWARDRFGSYAGYAQQYLFVARRSAEATRLLAHARQGVVE